MIFDPEKKGPSEFTDRNVIMSLFFTYIECAGPQERMVRAQTVLGYLRDPEGKEEKRPISFVLQMRRNRPYRIWCKEVVNVTKEVFWIFLHHLNVVAAPPAAKNEPGPAPRSVDHTSLATSTDQPAYMVRHFPQERPPVPAAPYVGGVEWEATNYLAAHLDLLNALVACSGPTAVERNMLRAELRISGWERVLGGSLRLCKEKFYGAVHDGLRTWVAAAADDGWDVRDVRFGPPPIEKAPGSTTTPTVKLGGGGGGGGAGGKKKKKEQAPRIEMPNLNFDLDAKPIGSAEPWLS
jgi:hypothetical protein